jgi:hypothetical protein
MDRVSSRDGARLLGQGHAVEGCPLLRREGSDERLARGTPVARDRGGVDRYLRQFAEARPELSAFTCDPDVALEARRDFVAVASGHGRQCVRDGTLQIAVALAEVGPVVRDGAPTLRSSRAAGRLST